MPETRVWKGRGIKTSTRSAGGGPDLTVEANSISVVIVTLERGWLQEGRMPG